MTVEQIDAVTPLQSGDEVMQYLPTPLELPGSPGWPHSDETVTMSWTAIDIDRSCVLADVESSPQPPSETSATNSRHTRMPHRSCGMARVKCRYSTHLPGLKSSSV